MALITGALRPCEGHHGIFSIIVDVPFVVGWEVMVYRLWRLKVHPPGISILAWEWPSREDLSPSFKLFA